MFKNPKHLLSDTQNTLWIMIALLISFQILMWIVTFGHFSTSEHVKEIMLVDRTGSSEQDLFLYRFYVIMAIAIWAIGFFGMICIQSSEAARRRKLLKIFSLELFVSTIIFFAYYKKILYNDPQSAKLLFNVGLGLSLAAKFLWLKIEEFFQALENLSNVLTQNRMIQLVVLMLVTQAIVLLVFVPNPQGLVGAIFSADQLNAWDRFVMAPAWAHLNGQKVFVDVSSAQGAWPTVIGQLSQAFTGGLNYENALSVVIVLSIIYYVCIYSFLQFWLKNVWFSSAVILILIKLQVFHDKIIFNDPSQSAVPFLFDAGVLLSVVLFLKTNQYRFIWGAVIAVALSLVYALEVGMYQYLALCAFLLMILFTQESKKGFLSVVIIAPLVLAAIILGLFVGGHIFTSEFWQNMTIVFYPTTTTLEPLTNNLLNRHYWDGFIVFIVPWMYLITLLYAITQVILKKDTESAFISLLCVYGLLLYHDFSTQAISAHVYTYILPYLLIITYWIKKALDFLSPITQRRIQLAFFVLAIFAVTTTHNVLQAPNVFDFTKVDFATQKEGYLQNINPRQDIDLIQSLTVPNEKVCLLSSFEVALLIKSQRTFLLYYTPMIRSVAFEDPNIGSLNLSKRRYLEHGIKYIQTAKPVYIFVEKKFFKSLLSPDKSLSPALNYYLRNLIAGYKPYIDGKYLIALKREGP